MSGPWANPNAIAVEWIAGSEITRWELTSPSQLLSIGRDAGCDCQLDADDRGISRRAASIFFSGGSWWLANLSSSRPIDVREPSGSGSVLDTDGRRAIDRGQLTFVLTGVIRRHGIRITRPEHADALDDDFDAFDPERTVALPLPSAAEREALVAMVEGFLYDFPRWNPVPRNYADSAARLGVPSSTVRKRIESFRTKLQNAGLAGVDTPDARDELAELVLGTRLITIADLSLLGRSVRERS